MSLITIDDWKAWARQQLPATEDAELIELLATAQAQIEAYCRRAFSAAAATDVLDGTGTAIIELTRTPINSITEIRLGNAAPYEVLAASDYTFYPETGIVQLLSSPLPAVRQVRSGRRWPEGERNITVDYNGGPSSAPRQVVLALKMQLSALWFSRGQDPRVTGSSAGRH